MFTLAVKDLYSSYKDLPVWLYQIQTKYRDEARPRAGILRGREFVMKDSYSFDTTDAGLDASYAAHRDAYVRTFDRLGFDYVIVKATSGAMGGSKSEEFLARAEVGEDTYVRCTQLRLRRQRRGGAGARRPHPSRTTTRPRRTPSRRPTPRPSRPWSTHLNEKHPRDDRPWTAGDTLKNVLVVLKHADGTREPLAIGLPGDREVDQKRLEGQLEPIEVEPMDEAEIAQAPDPREGLHRARRPGGEGHVRYPLRASTPGSSEGTRWVTGANVDGSHVLDLVVGRDFTPDGTIEAAEVRDGDPCPNCESGTLHTARGIEMGHIFQLGRMYAEALDLQVLDENGKLVIVTMGSYGIGVSRAVAAIAEGNNDELGLVWPREISPADVHVVATGKDEVVFSTAAELVRELSAAGLDVLYDDRPKVSPGVKFKDAELIGVPTIVTVGRGLADGNVEVKDRRSDERQQVPLPEAVARITGSSAPEVKVGSRRARPPVSRRSPEVAAVIFDWGGTLTPWHDIDFAGEAEALARAVVAAEGDPDTPRCPAAGRDRDRLGALPRPPAERDARVAVRGGRSRPRPGAAARLSGVLGAAHAHRPGGCAGLAHAARAGHPGRRALQHDLAPGVAPGLLRPGRRARPPGRRRVHQRGPVDQAVAAGVPGRDGGRGCRRPSRLRLRGRPSLRRRVGCTERRDARDPRAAQ